MAEREAVATTEAARRAAQEADKRALEEQLQRTLRERRDSSDEASALRSQLEALGAEAAAAHERKVTEVQTLRGAVDAAVADRGRLDEQYAALQADLAAATALAGQQGEELADVRCQLVESENQRQAAAMGCEFATTALRQAQQELNELVRLPCANYRTWVYTETRWFFPHVLRFDIFPLLLCLPSTPLTADSARAVSPSAQRCGPSSLQSRAHCPRPSTTCRACPSSSRHCTRRADWIRRPSLLRRRSQKLVVVVGVVVVAVGVLVV